MSRPEEKTVRSSQTGTSACDASEVKRRRKRRTLTMCDVCNIQLNSSAQAQIHYNGKTHQRRLRRADRQKLRARDANATGSPARRGALLTSLPVQAQLDLKHFLPLSVSNSSPLNPFSNFNMMDPVQKAVISHTFSIAQSLKKKQIITCNICYLRFNSTNQAEAHYKGHKHAQKLKAMDKLKSRQRILGKCVWRERGRKKPVNGEKGNGGVSERTASQAEDGGIGGVSVTQSPASITSQIPCASKRIPESPAFAPRLTCDSKGVMKGNRSRRKCSRSLQCPVCKVSVNSGSQLQEHFKGSKHRLMLGRRRAPPRKRAGNTDAPGAAPRLQHLSLKSDQSHHCNACGVDVNSEAQLRQHMSSRRHRDRATGTPPKRQLNNSAHSVFMTKLTLQKELSRTLTSSFPTSALTPASLCAIPTGPFALSHAHPLPTIIHAPLFNPALFRPALAPLRPTHGPIVFSPY